MESKKIIIKDENKLLYFGYIEDYPFICSQSFSLENLNYKLNLYFNIFIDRYK